MVLDTPRVDLSKIHFHALTWCHDALGAQCLTGNELTVD